MPAAKKKTAAKKAPAKLQGVTKRDQRLAKTLPDPEDTKLDIPLPRFDPTSDETEKPDPEALSNVLKISHCPYGFVEEPAYNYFRQFGVVTRIRVKRNKTGGFSGIVYVAFKYAEVASIVQTVVDRTIMMRDHVVKCKQLRNNELPPFMQPRPAPLLGKPPLKKAARIETFCDKVHAADDVSPEEIAEVINKSLEKAKKLGIDYTFDFSAKLAAAVATKS